MTSTIDELPHVFATLRFAGDNLDPEQISAVLGIAPRRAYQKGEAYYSGKRAVTLSGRTGIWLLFTDRLTASRDLADHLAILESLLCPAPHDIRRLARLRDIVNRTGATTSISVFWYGRAGDMPPVIPKAFARLAGELGADVETDYHTEDAITAA